DTKVYELRLGPHNASLLSGLLYCSLFSTALVSVAVGDPVPVDKTTNATRLPGPDSARIQARPRVWPSQMEQS
ncbi:MAG: hypothetical protein AAF597_04740, partial [Bacteroidota bacterium]